MGAHGTRAVVWAALIAEGVIHGHGFDLVWGLITAGIGAVLGVALQALVSRGQAKEIPAILLTSRTSMVAAVVVAPRQRCPATSARGGARRRKPLLSEDETLVFASAIALGAVALFLRWRDPIAAGVALGSLFLYGCELGMIAYVSLRRTVRRFDVFAALTGALVVVTVGFADARALAKPRFFGDSYAKLLHAFDKGGVSRVIDQFGLEGVVFILYQALGLLFFAAGVVLALASLTYVVARLNHSLASRGQWLWARLASIGTRPYRGPIATIALACGFAVVSWILCSGLGYEVVHALVTKALRFP